MLVLGLVTSINLFIIILISTYIKGGIRPHAKPIQKLTFMYNQKYTYLERNVCPPTAIHWKPYSRATSRAPYCHDSTFLQLDLPTTLPLRRWNQS